MEEKRNFTKYILAAFCVMAIIIASYVLLKYPQPGVADQGDFDRVMGASGLELRETDRNNPNFNRFYKYIVTDYKISDTNVKGVLSRFINTSMAYLITLINFVCKLLRQDIFKTGYLAVAYTLIYSFAIFNIIKYLNIKNKVAAVLLVFLSLFILFDGNYLVWFNSLYGEPMMLTMLLLYIASLLYYNYNRNVIKAQNKIFISIVFVFLGAFLFLGSKMQVLTALPIIILMNIKLLWENKRVLKRSEFWALGFVFLIIIAYPLQINMRSKAIGKDTQYNSVFYGVLKDSKNPRQDLIDMGLNPDMAVEAGKHSYLDAKEYVKYVPRTEITEREFYSKISNGKLIKFYITHPVRFMKGMEYTAGNAFLTSTSLGKYKESFSKEPIRGFHRFTVWSSFREKYLPKKLMFIFVVYAVVLGVSLFTYCKNKRNKELRGKIEILLAILFISVLQFPMPFMGNGQADTAKQLYLFNFIFDLILITSVCFCFSRLISISTRDK